jgi:Kef-type K+ transport system membrane component KefB
LDAVGTTTLITIALAMVAAAGVPVLLPRLRVPGVVFEILLGVLVGPHVLDFVEPDVVLDFLADLGLGMLFLMAGFDLDPPALRGHPIRNALAGWGVTLMIAFLAAALLVDEGLADAWLMIGLALSTTSVGVLLPVLRDDGLLRPPYGPMVLAAGAIGEAGPVIVLSLLLAKGGAPAEALILVAFAAAAVGAVVLAARVGGEHLAGIVERSIGTSGQLPIRLALFLLIVLTVVSRALDIDIVLGAFVAGAVLRAAVPRRHDQAIAARLDGLGPSFLVPIFFVTSGMRMDVAALFSEPAMMAMVPVFALLMLAARGVPAFLFYRADLAPPEQAALALHSGTQLTLIVAITSLAVDRGVMPAGHAAALVVAGILTVLCYPALAAWVLRRAPQRS